MTWHIPKIKLKKESSPTYLFIDHGDTAMVPASSRATTAEMAGWRPFWCKRTVIATFLALSIALLVALESVNSFSASHHGIAEAAKNDYYLWTYGPTAIFTFVVAFWNRVDYRIRQTTPWTILLAGEASASTSILLNYISPTRPEICWHSLRKRHWAVFSSSLVVVLQTLLIVLSTALFTLAPSPKALDDVTFVTTSRLLRNMTRDPGYLNSGIQYQLARNAGYVYDAIHFLNLSYPFGTTPKHVYQRFRLDGYAEAASTIQTATVDVLDMEYSCEKAQLNATTWEASPEDNFSTRITWEWNVTTPGCFIEYRDLDFTPVEYGDDGEISLFAAFTTTACSSSTIPAPIDALRIMLVVGLAEQVGEVTWNSTGEPASTNTTRDPWVQAHFAVKQSQQWICRWDPLIKSASVSFNSSELAAGYLPKIDIQPDAPSRVFPNVSSYWKVVTAWSDNHNAPLPSFRTDNVSAGILSPKSRVAPFIDHVLRVMPNATQQELVETDLLLEMTQQVGTELFVQNAHLSLVEDDDTEVDGHAVVYTDRLIVRQVPLRLVESVLGLSIILLALLCLLTPHKSSSPFDPAPLDGICKILASSPGYYSMFEGLGAASNRKLRTECDAMKFSSFFNIPEERPTAMEPRAFSIISEGTTAENKSLRSEKSEETLDWWRPWTVAVLCRSLMVLAVIAAIVVLQVLLNVSNVQQGLGNISVVNDEHLLWSLIPAGIMTSIAIYFGAVDSIYRTYGPYHKLKQSAPAAPSVLAHYLSQTKVELLITSFRHRQFALLSITLCTLVSSFFTIIVSGVFTPSQVPRSESMSILPTSWFQAIASNDTGTLGLSGKIAGLVFQVNLSYPSWTYRDLVFGSWQTSDTEDDSWTNNDDTVLVAVIPAIRSSLNCTLYDQQDIPDLLWYNSQVDSSWQEPMYTGVVVNLPGSQECRINPNNSTVYLAWTSTSDPSELNIPPFTWFGYRSGVDPDCPQHNYFWGRQDVNEPNVFNDTQWDQNATSVTYAKALSCFDVIEKVDVSTTFVMPDFKIDERNPPIVDESTTEVFSTARVEVPYESLLGSGEDRDANDDAFFQVLNENLGLDVSSYGESSQTEQIVALIKKAHGIMRAQQYNNVLRKSIGSDGQSDAIEAVQGMVTDGNRWRLVQNGVSTHVLCALLAIALLFATIASFMIDTKEVLPKDPCTIGAVTSLLADSNLLSTSEKVPATDAKRDKTWLRRALHWTRGPNKDDGAIYTMGFFERENDGRRIFGIRRIDQGPAIPLIPKLEGHAPATLIEQEASALPLNVRTCPARKPVPATTATQHEPYLENRVSSTEGLEDEDSSLSGRSLRSSHSRVSSLSTRT